MEIFKLMSQDKRFLELFDVFVHMYVPCTLPVRSGRRPAVLMPCTVQGWLDLRGSAAQAEDAGLKPSGAGWTGPYGIVPGGMQSHENTHIV